MAWLQDLFSTAGTVTDVKLVKDKATGQSAGSAFVKFEEHHAAAVALQTINGQSVYGKVRMGPVKSLYQLAGRSAAHVAQGSIRAATAYLSCTCWCTSALELGRV